MARVERLTVYPVKALEGLECETTRVIDGGTLAHDREFALFDDEGDVLNGRRTARVHDVETTYDPETRQLSAAAPGHERATFELGTDSGRERASEWFSGVFDVDLTLARDTDLGYVDRREMGPSVVSTATLETVASWFDELTVDSVRRRLRANVEIGGVPAFWEDRFVGDGAPAFRAGDVRFEGETPCGRCIVPERDPDTGDSTPEFRERFVERRGATFPDFADRSAFDHFYTLMLIASVPAGDRGESVRVGDDVTVLE